jgi:hypothetical protein
LRAGQERIIQNALTTTAKKTTKVSELKSTRADLASWWTQLQEDSPV